MVTPVRFTGGLTQDAVWQPFGQVGVPDPMFYHQTWDDFDFFDTNEWTTIVGSTGAVASIAGDGGLVTATTAATLNDFEGFQRKVAGFTFSPPNGTTVAGKKLLYLTRISLNNASAGFIAGLVNTAANPFTGTTDGLYVSKAINSAVVNLISNVGGTATTVPFPTAVAALLVANQAIDVGVFYNPSNGYGVGPTMVGFMGINLIGYQPQSGSGAANAAGNPSRQPVVSFLQVNGTTPTPTTANLNPTVAVLADSANARVMTVDFMYAGKER